MALAKDYSIKLNVRIGFIKFREQVMFFENTPQMGELSIAQSSANSEFIRNKAQLTTFNSPRSQRPQDGVGVPSYFSINQSNVTSVLTPRTFTSGGRTASVATANQLSLAVEPKKIGRHRRRVFLAPEEQQGIKMVCPPHQLGQDVHETSL